METASEIKAFNKLFAEYHGLFVRFANTYLQDEVAAEDIAVEGICIIGKTAILFLPIRISRPISWKQSNINA